MCIGIIGQCQCFRCMDRTTPGKLLRIEFCPKQQDELVGVWDPSSPQTERLVPCDNLTFDRVRDPDSCHFKKKDDMKDESKVSNDKLTQPENNRNEETSKDAVNPDATPNLASTPADAAPASPHTSIRFLPINAAEVARPALASPTKDKGTPTKRMRTAAQNKVDDGDKADKADMTDNNANKGNDNSDKMDIDPASATTGTDTDIDIGAGVAPETPSKSTGKQISSRATPGPATATPSGRKRLPDNRPRTPRVLEATAAAAAAATTAEAASRAPGGQWTHEETIKLLALRAKGVGFEGMGEYLPGRDAASCLDRLSELAVKFGFQEFI